MYAILDIEATGGKKGEERIIDIAIYTFDGEKIVDQFASMVNPPRAIDPYVQKLTGITTKMVKRAPKFHELAKRIVEITNQTVLVGHDVKFDYRMLRQEFEQLGYDFKIETLDTLTISQELLPEAETYSLGKLCKALGIPLKERHRAAGDAKATLELFKILLEKDKGKKIIQSQKSQAEPSPEKNKKLLKLEQNIPNKAGILYLQNKDGKLLYISRTSNLAQRLNHLFTRTDRRHIRLQNQTETVRFELTGSMLIGLIKEYSEIKINQPPLNPKYTSSHFSVGIFSDKNQYFIDSVKEENQTPTIVFKDRKKAHQFLNRIENNNNSESEDDDLKKISLTEDNQIIIDFKHRHFAVIDKGRNNQEKSFIEIKNGQIIGYGFYTIYKQLEDESVRNQLRINFEGTDYLKAIILNYIYKKKKIQIKEL